MTHGDDEQPWRYRAIWLALLLVPLVPLAVLALSAARLPIRWGFVAAALPIALAAALLMPRADRPSAARERASDVVLVGGGLLAGMLFYGDHWSTWPASGQVIAVPVLWYYLAGSIPAVRRHRWPPRGPGAPPAPPV